MTDLPDRRRVILSEDRREMTIVTQTLAGTHRAVLGRGPEQDPFNAEDVRYALEAILPTLSAPGQRNTTRRWVTPVGTVYAHLMLGPPTWRLPKIELRRGGLMVGWLRAAVAFGFRSRRREGGSDRG